MSSKSDEATRVFEDVIKNFLDSLGSNEKSIFKEFRTSKEMLEDLQIKCKEVRNERKMSMLCHKIERFAAALEPFFQIISIFVESHPEFAGIAWGAIRLIFLLGKNYTVHLEKLVSMAQQIGEMLPAYEEYFNLFISRRKTLEGDLGSAFTLEIRHHRLHKALSYVYADIIQFCQEACKIFGSKRGGTRYKPSLIADVFWKPFDSRFSSLLDRMKSHREVFQAEMQLEESKYLEAQNDKRAYQSELYGKALKQIQSQIEDLRKSNLELDLKLSNQKTGFEFAFQDLRRNFEQDVSIEAREREALAAKVTDIKAWIKAPEYMCEYEKARRLRLPETGDYLLQHPIYVAWKCEDHTRVRTNSEMGTPRSPNLLIIKGKPGFGKTILSSLIIEDIQDSIGPVLFYHFSSEKRDSCGPFDGLRAVLVQLIHAYRDRKDLIDQLAVLMDTLGCGQTTASDEEIVAGLSLFLATGPQAFLLFDAVDECENYAYFLDLLREVSTKTSTKVLLLGRQNVELPPGLPFLSLYLDQAWNLADIKLYLHPGVVSLQERRLIPATVDVQKIVETLARRAEGMFLWAWLMIQYLNCRALSPKERLESIVNPDPIDGLNEVYGKILLALNRGYQKEKNRVVKIFEVIAVAVRPLHISELKIAVSISPGFVTEPSDLIVDFESTLPVICGNLVEVQSDKTVRFIHSSFRNFLTSKYQRQDDALFVVNETNSHVALSMICLSYIVYDLPSSPVCQEMVGNDIDEVKMYFPFVAYALHWSEHAVQGFDATSGCAEILGTAVQDDFYTLLTRFLNRPLSITVWIEVSWLFRSRPSLTMLLNTFSDSKCLGSRSLFNSGNIAITMLREFSAQLEELNKDWGHLLGKDPKAIWGPSITAFSKSSYWYQTRDTVVSSMLPSEATGAYKSGSAHWSVLVKSQVSTSGEELGMAMVLPSR